MVMLTREIMFVKFLAHDSCLVKLYYFWPFFPNSRWYKHRGSQWKKTVNLKRPVFFLILASMFLLSKPFISDKWVNISKC